MYYSNKHILENSPWAGSNIGKLVFLSVTILFAGSHILGAQDLPTGGVVTGGTGVISTSDTDMTIKQKTDALSIDWNSFDIGANNQVEFKQPSSTSSALNRIIGGSASDILGSLKANGRVFIVNPSGVLFGKDARVDVGGLAVSTLDIKATDFHNGNYVFDGSSTAQIIHKGQMVAVDGVSMIATQITNTGKISAGKGGISLVAGGRVRLNFGLSWGIEVDAATVDTLVEQGGALRVTDGIILLEAKSSGVLLKQMLNHTGTSTVRTLAKDASGAIHFRSSGHVTLAGKSSATVYGGTIGITANSAMLGGTLDVSSTKTGVNGGSIAIDVKGRLNLSGTVRADSATANGGAVTISAGSVIETSSGRTSANGAVDGGRISIATYNLFMSSGQYSANGGTNAGGQIDVGGDDIRLFGSRLSASGGASGGLIRIGGAFQGGKTPDTSKDYNSKFIGRWGKLSALSSAKEVYVGGTTKIDVSSASGDGGTAVIWSDKRTTFLGGIDARGGTGAGAGGSAAGGAVEISSANLLRRASLDKVQIGAGGTLLLDPTNITIGVHSDYSGWAYTAAVTLDGASSHKRHIDVSTLGFYDQFGQSVSLSGKGDRLAVGARGDDGKDGKSIFDFTDYGAVYLFSFTDVGGAFNGGKLEATIGKGYTGGKNIDVALDKRDQFGHSVSLNDAGDRLVVGANRDDGFDNKASGSGAVYLFSFDDGDFTNGQHVGTIGSGYTTGKSVNVAGISKSFGNSVSLNAAGDRLAVGASFNLSFDVVHLFSFDTTLTKGVSGTDFTNGKLEATMGKGYSATTAHPKNIDVADLEAHDGFGSVSLNGAGDRLAVGVSADDGFANGLFQSGAVYLFTFADTIFTGGTHIATIGGGYTRTTANPKNINVANLGKDDGFGVAVSFNGDGDMLAVGAVKDDGLGDLVRNAGAMYFFVFTDKDVKGASDPLAGGELLSIIGKGYLPTTAHPHHVDVIELVPDDGLGRALSLSAVGSRLAVGAPGDDASRVDLPTVNFFTLPSSDVIIGPESITALITAGTDVILQASNDITVRGQIIVADSTGSEKRGSLTLQAGRSIHVNAAIKTGNGALSLIANETVAEGVVDIYRNSGDAIITTNTFGSINAGTGAVSILLKGADAAKTHSGAGHITLRAITASTIKVRNLSPTSTSAVIAHGKLTASAAGSDAARAIQIQANIFTNTIGAGALTTSNPNGKWVIWSKDNKGHTLGGLSPDFFQVHANFGVTTIDARGNGKNGFLYSDGGTLTLLGSSPKAADFTKTYDGDTSSKITASHLTIVGQLDGDVVTFSNLGTSVYDNKNAGIGKKITLSGIAASVTKKFTNQPVYGYILATTVEGYIGTITPKPLSVASATASGKTYDGGTLATITHVDGTLTGGFVNNEVVTLVGASTATGVFDTKTAGTAKTVTVQGLSLLGDALTLAANYKLVPLTTTAAITKKTLTLPTGVAVSRAYDGGFVAQVKVATSLTGLETGDVVTLTGASATGVFDTKNAGDNIPVTVSGLSLAGGDAGNYALKSMKTTANITKKILTLPTGIAVSRDYNGKVNAQINLGVSLAGVETGDDITISGASASGIFDTKDVGTNKIVTVGGLSLIGGDVGNYKLKSMKTTADITVKTLSFAARSGSSVVSRHYNGGTGATITVGALAGIQNNEGITAAPSAIFAGKDVGTHSVLVTYKLVDSSGVETKNYALAGETLTGTITQKPLSVVGLTVANKRPDNTIAATITNFGTLYGVVSGESKTVTLDSSKAEARFVDARFGIRKTVKITGLSLGGASKSNYILSAQPTATANIFSPIFIPVLQSIFDVFPAPLPVFNTIRANIPSDELGVILPRNGSNRTTGELDCEANDYDDCSSNEG